MMMKGGQMQRLSRWLVCGEKVPSAASVKLITEEETTILIIRIFIKGLKQNSQNRYHTF